MQYGLMTYPNNAKRTDLPDMSKLPTNCCARCWQWCEEFDHNNNPTGYGQCFEHSTDEWGQFSWADDKCGQFDKRNSEE